VDATQAVAETCRRRPRDDGDDDDDDDELRSYVRPLLQLETVTSVLVIRPGKQFSFQITTERGCTMRCWKRIPGGRSCHGEAARTVSERPCGWNSKSTTCCRVPSVGDDDQRYQRPAGTW